MCTSRVAHNDLLNCFLSECLKGMLVSVAKSIFSFCKGRDQQMLGFGGKLPLILRMRENVCIDSNQCIHASNLQCMSLFMKKRKSETEISCMQRLIVISDG